APSPEPLAFIEPAEGARFSNRDAISVTVEFAGQTPVELQVNGQVVGKERIGLKSFDPATGRSRFGFVNVRLSAGPNRLVATLTAGATHRVERTVFFAMRPVRLVVEPAAPSFAADGRTSAQLRVAAVDEHGTPASDGTQVTVTVDEGQFVGSDSNPELDGFQVRMQGGQALVSLTPVAHSAVRRVEAFLEDLSGRGEVRYVPEKDSDFLIARGDLTFGANRTSGRVEAFSDEVLGRDRFARGELALFLKKQVLTDHLLTLGYDSNRDRERGKLFRSFDPDEFYPIYGDSTAQDYDAESRDDLYLRLEKDLSYVMWGDYRTDLASNELTGYTRTLTGAKVNLEEGRLHARGFYSHTDQTLVQEELPGGGVSGLYFLHGVPLIENSETVFLEVRNRFMPTQVLERRSLGRFTDYDIDYFQGTLLFKFPVRSLDDNFNPVYIVARYETFNSPRDLDVYGGRVAYDFAPWVSVGVTDLVEEQFLGDRKLQGVDLRLSMFDRLEVKAETARSEAPEVEGGAAYKLDLKFRVTDQATLSGVYRKVEDTFENPSMSGAFRQDFLNPAALGLDPVRRTNQTFGATNFGLRLELAPDTHQMLVAEHLMREEPFNNFGVRADTAEYLRKFDWGSASVGYVHAEGPTDAASTDAVGNLVRVAVKRQLNSKLALVGLRQEVVDGSPVREFPNRTSGGLEYTFNDATRTYLRYEEDDGDTFDARRLVSGVESALGRDTTAYSRYQLDGGTSGQHNVAGLGVRTARRLNDRLGLNFNVERQQVLMGSTSFGIEDFTAAGLGVEYLESIYKLTGRLELRFGEREDNVLASLGGSFKANDDVSLFLRGRHYVAATEDGTPRRASLDVLFGSAYRPERDDRLNALVKLRYLEGDSMRGFGFGFADTERHSLIGSLAAGLELTTGTQLSGTVALQEAVDATGRTPYTGLTTLWAGRLSHDLTPDWGLALRYAVLGERAGKTERESYGVELDRVVKENFFIGVGYNFEGFDDRVFPEADRTSEGPFVAARFRY
ncbi:MAG: hypothetical protein HY814_05650, partial [Candidatus Riflebacteria bacterium]|nr:hypothetical protein [Candidatus Riflebacteria bacterium]